MLAVANTTKLQGDIIIDYPFIVPTTDELKIIERNIDGSLKTTPISQTQNPYLTSKAFVIANSFMSDAIIISQSCDIQRRNYIHLSPVKKISLLIQELSDKEYDEKRINNVIDSLKDEKINYYFYIPGDFVGGVTLEDSYVDLEVVGIVPLANLSPYNRPVTLTDLGRHRLSFKLINLYGRPF